VFLKKFFADLERQLRLEIGGMPIQLEVRVDSKLVARFDEGRVARAVHNLARNAIEAMAEKGGTLTISAELREDGLALSIADTGPGIPKEIEDRVFQSFFTAGKRGGTGLGLAIVKKIVDEHGGRITLSSSSAGTRFELVIPQSSRDPSAQPPAPDSGRA
jgi:signal transduction histidine kinase